MTDEEDVLAAALADAQKGSLPTSENLKKVDVLMRRQLYLEDHKATLEAQLEQCNKDLAKTMDELLPDALQEAECSRFDTSDGYSVVIKPTYFASVVEDNKPEFYDWCIDNGHEGIVKVEVVIPLGRGQHKEALWLQERVNRLLNRNDVYVKDSVHHSTLKAFAKELFEANADIPKSLSVHYVNRAKITRPKKVVKE